VPRIINVICDATLVFGYAEERRQVDRALLGEVLAELEATGVLPVSGGLPDSRPVTASPGARDVPHEAQPATTASPSGVRTPPPFSFRGGASGQRRLAPRERLAAGRVAGPGHTGALIERAALLDQREQALRQRERELVDQRRVLSEEYRLLRTQRPAAPASPPAAAVRVHVAPRPSSPVMAVRAGAARDAL